MYDNRYDFYSKLETRSFPDKKQLITYSYNNHVRMITGIMLENKDFIYLYEYRGKYTGIEFLISFSKESTTYKFIKAEEIPS